MEAVKGYDRIRELLLEGEFPKEMIGEVVESYESLGVERGDSLSDMVWPAPLKASPVMNSPKLSGQSSISKLRCSKTT